jgi:ClpP class serine protease
MQQSTEAARQFAAATAAAWLAGTATDEQLLDALGLLDDAREAASQELAARRATGRRQFSA